jgi:hypothetical protein
LGPAGGIYRTLHVHHLGLLHHVGRLLLCLRAACTRLHEHDHLLLLLAVLLMMAACRLPLSTWHSSCWSKLRVLLLVLRGHRRRRHEQPLELLHHLRELRMLLYCCRVQYILLLLLLLRVSSWHNKHRSWPTLHLMLL